MLLAEAAQLSDEQVDELVAAVAAGLRRLEPQGAIGGVAFVKQLFSIKSMATAGRLSVPQAQK